MISKPHLLKSTLVSAILIALLIPGVVFAAPVSFDWGTFNSTGLTTFGVYDTNNTTILQTGDLAQLIWAGPDGAIDLPRCNGTTTGDDQVLDSTSVLNDAPLPPPARNRGYIPFKTYTFDTVDPQSGGVVYIRAWNSSTASTGTAYGNSQTASLAGGGTFNAARWHTANTDCVPLAVTIASLAATYENDHVSIVWETASEIGNQGFNLYRNTELSVPETPLAFVPSQAPGSGQGYSYEYLDTEIVDGEIYYWLQDIDLNGVTSMHGPVSVTIQAPTAVSLAQLVSEAGIADQSVWLLLFGTLLLVAVGGIYLVNRRNRIGHRDV